MQKYDIYRFDMPYDEYFIAENPVTKNRPILIVYIEDENTFITISMITTKSQKSDYKIIDWKEAGLDRPSWIRFSKKSVTQKNMLGDYVGHLSDNDIQRIKSMKLIKESLDKSDITKAPFYKEYLEWENYWKERGCETNSYDKDGVYIPLYDPWIGHTLWNPNKFDEWDKL